MGVQSAQGALRFPQGCEPIRLPGAARRGVGWRGAARLAEALVADILQRFSTT
jgi:hypothetical protein